MMFFKSALALSALLVVVSAFNRERGGKITGRPGMEQLLTR